MLFHNIVSKAQHLQRWRGHGDVLTLLTPPSNWKGPPRKLSLEQEFLLVLMRLRMALLVEDLAFRFHFTSSQVSSIFTMWIKFLARELGVLIVWASKVKVKKKITLLFQENVS